MDLTNLLKYQELDEKLYNVEQRLTKSPARKRAGELSKIAKNAQVKSNELEAEASKVIKEIEDVKVKFEENKKSLQSLLNKDLDKLSMEDLDKITSLGKNSKQLKLLRKTSPKTRRACQQNIDGFQ